MNIILKSSIFALVLFGVVCFRAPFSRFSTPFQDPELKEVRATVLDYVEGIYQADSLRIEKSVHPRLIKRGTSYNSRTRSFSTFKEMNFEQLVELSKNWNKNGEKANKRSVKNVEVFDIQDHTASAKVTAVWGTDYLHLGKLNGKWVILNVLWQSPSQV